MWQLLIPFLLWLVYRYLTRNFDYWSKQNVPFVKPRIIVGSLNLKRPMHEIELEQYQKNGRIYGGFDGGQPYLTVGDPELLRKILVKDFHVFPNHRDLKSGDSIMDNILFVLEGQDWKRVRNIISPIFTTAKLRKMMYHLEESSDDVLKEMEKIVGKEKIICQKQFCRFSIRTISRCAFGIRFNDEAEENIMESSKGTFSCLLSWRTICILLFPKLVKWLHISLLNPGTIAYYSSLMKDVVERSKMTDRTERADFMQRLIDAEDHNHNSKNIDVNSAGMDNTEHLHTTFGLTPDETMAQCINFFMAGFDATTSLMSHAVYHLATNPEYQDQFHREIETVLSKHENQFTYEAVSEMKFLDAVLCESLRLCPSLVRLERRAEEDYVLGDTGIVVKKGMIISIPVYAMHRDPEWYPEPERFRPERFLSTELAPPQYTYLPFSSGPRICLGKRFVEVSSKICLAKLFQKFKIEVANPAADNLEIIEMRAVLKVSNVEIKLSPRR